VEYSNAKDCRIGRCAKCAIVYWWQFEGKKLAAYACPQCGGALVQTTRLTKLPIRSLASAPAAYTGDGAELSEDRFLRLAQLRREAERLERKAARGNATYAAAAKEAREDYERAASWDTSHLFPSAPAPVRRAPQRNRKVLKLTVSDEGRAALERLAEANGESISRIVEALALETWAHGHAPALPSMRVLSGLMSAIGYALAGTEVTDAGGVDADIPDPEEISAARRWVAEAIRSRRVARHIKLPAKRPDPSTVPERD